MKGEWRLTWEKRKRGGGGQNCHFLPPSPCISRIRPPPLFLYRIFKTLALAPTRTREEKKEEEEEERRRRERGR